jgi:hypothetical protein
MKACRLLGRVPPFVSDFSIATELYAYGLGDVGSQRSAAASESAGCELNASFACGAFSCSTLISRSNRSAMGGRVRRPAPITMTSQRLSLRASETWASIVACLSLAEYEPYSLNPSACRANRLVLLSHEI